MEPAERTNKSISGEEGGKTVFCLGENIAESKWKVGDGRTMSCFRGGTWIKVKKIRKTRQHFIHGKGTQFGRVDIQTSRKVKTLKIPKRAVMKSQHPRCKA